MGGARRTTGEHVPRGSAPSPKRQFTRVCLEPCDIAAVGSFLQLLLLHLSALDLIRQPQRPPRTSSSCSLHAPLPPPTKYVSFLPVFSPPLTPHLSSLGGPFCAAYSARLRSCRRTHAQSHRDLASLIVPSSWSQIQAQTRTAAATMAMALLYRMQIIGRTIIPTTILSPVPQHRPRRATNQSSSLPLTASQAL